MNRRVMMVGGALVALASCATQPTPRPAGTVQRQQQTQQGPPAPVIEINSQQGIAGPRMQNLYREQDDPIFGAMPPAPGFE